MTIVRFRILLVVVRCFWNELGRHTSQFQFIRSGGLYISSRHFTHGSRNFKFVYCFLLFVLNHFCLVSLRSFFEQIVKAEIFLLHHVIFLDRGFLLLNLTLTVCFLLTIFNLFILLFFLNFTISRGRDVRAR